MSPLNAFGLTIFILVLFLAIFVCIHGLPGMLLIVADVLVYSIITGFEKIGWKAALAVIIVAVAVETGDVFWAMQGSPRFRPSRQTVLFSFAGSCLFALLLTPPFLVAGLVGGFFLGGMIGLFCTTIIQEAKLNPSYRMPFSVLFSRTSALFVKGSVAAALVCFTLLSSYD